MTTFGNADVPQSNSGVLLCVADTEFVAVSVETEAALTAVHANAEAAGVVSSATSILNAAEYEAKCVAVLAAASTVAVAEACANTVATAAETQAVAVAAAVVVAAAASTLKAVELVASAAHAPERATAAIVARDAQNINSLSEHRKQRHKPTRLLSSIVQGGYSHSVRRESRAIRIISTIVGKTHNLKALVHS
ncbi:unnamed protein product [Sphagnum balticum]